jgi:hypothetical protein
MMRSEDLRRIAARTDHLDCKNAAPINSNALICGSRNVIEFRLLTPLEHAVVRLLSPANLSQITERLPFVLTRSVWNLTNGAPSHDICTCLC